MGVPLGRQVYLGLADGNLEEQATVLTESVQDAVDWIKPDRVITTGLDGYDGHPDHIATHMAAVSVADAMSIVGYDVMILALSAGHTGEVHLLGDIDRKLGAMGLHASQVVVPDLLQWGGTDLYTPLVTEGEAYTTSMAAW